MMLEWLYVFNFLMYGNDNRSNWTWKVAPGILTPVGFYFIMIIRCISWMTWAFITTFSLCGAHPLERVGEMKSQKIQKGELFDSVDEKVVMVKTVEQGWGISYFTHGGEKGTYDTTQCSYCLQKQCNI